LARSSWLHATMTTTGCRSSHSRASTAAQSRASGNGPKCFVKDRLYLIEAAGDEEQLLNPLRGPAHLRAVLAGQRPADLYAPSSAAATRSRRRASNLPGCLTATLTALLSPYCGKLLALIKMSCRTCVSGFWPSVDVSYAYLVRIYSPPGRVWKPLPCRTLFRTRAELAELVRGGRLATLSVHTCTQAKWAKP
jgi:hypothetical protein